MSRDRLFTILVFLTVLLPIPCFSITWDNAYGGKIDDYAYSVQQTKDGGYIVAGATGSFGAGKADLWLLRLDGSGNVLWQKTYGGTGDDYAYSVQQTKDDGYIVAGATISFGAGGYDIWLLKLDGMGNVSWQKTYGGSNVDQASSVQQTKDGGYIVAGSTNSYGANPMAHDFWLLKLDGSGGVRWQKTYGVAIGWESPSSVQQTKDGGYIVAGGSDGFGAGGYNMWLLKVNGSGNILWQKTYSGPRPDWAEFVQQTKDGGYIVAGTTEGFGAGNGDVWLLKLDGSGNALWQKAYGGSNEDHVESVGQTKDGGYIVAGDTKSFSTGDLDLWLLKLDGSGNVLWQKTYGGGKGDDADSVQETEDGGYIVAGATESLGAGGRDLWVLKLDSGGNISSCNFSVENSSAKVGNTTATVSATNGQLSNTTASIEVTRIQGTDSDAKAARKCGDATVQRISPAADQVGEEITIKGKNFGSSQGTVYFGSVGTKNTLSWSNTQIRVAVPDTANTGPLAVAIGPSDTIGGQKEFAVLPTPPDKLRPSSGTPGGGTRVAFLAPSGVSLSQFSVLFGSKQASSVQVIQPNIIVCTSPPGTGPVDVKVTAGAVSAKVGTYTYQ